MFSVAVAPSLAATSTQDVPFHFCRYRSKSVPVPVSFPVCVPLTLEVYCAEY